VQLTGRSNYTRIGPQVGANLVGNPDLANDPTVAGLILAQFLKNKEGQIRSALASRNLRLAQKLVNGGSHGVVQFIDAFERGERTLPS
jgi:putative chitinase